ncbi:MAG: amino acid permease [Pseudohongiellaceae bacterium]|nr:amino acid permease [Pseudohongiellaceae bacterium]
MSTQSKYSARTGIALVIANMVGTGVFTSLGFQLLEIQSTFVIFMLWLIGGVLALCGALTYAELASRSPRSGGEYHFLSELYHPCVGFVSGWVSLTVGFAAPTALAAMTFAAYFDSAVGDSLPINRNILAITLVAFITFVHGRNRHKSADLQNWFTGIKVVLIIGYLAIIFFLAKQPQAISLYPLRGDSATILSGSFAVALIYVNYAYTGWNAATYITGEIDSPETNIPRVLITGTSIVLLLYLALNLSFLYAAPVETLAGKIEIGIIAVEHQFGQWAAGTMGAVLSILLISTISAMLMAGPRVLQMMGEDYPVFTVFSKLNDGGVPQRAIYLQGALAIALILSSTFDSILVFSGFILGLSSLATVLSIFMLRRKTKGLGKGYRVLAYPFPPLIYAGVMIWTLCFISINRPQEAVVALGILFLGAAAYFICKSKEV